MDSHERFKCKKKRIQAPSFIFPTDSNRRIVCKVPKVNFSQSHPSSHHNHLSHQALRVLGEDDTRGQLRKSITPVHYYLCIKPNLKTMCFEGCVAIKCQLHSPEIRMITLHSAALLISKVVWVDDLKGTRQEPTALIFHKTDYRLDMIFNPLLVSNTGVLLVTYNGHMDESMSHHGFYVSKYRDESGVTVNAVTKFPNAEARRCFPCFDEPALKATFGLCFVVAKTDTVVTNMPLKLVSPHRSNKELQTVEFHKTPKMSTFSLAFAIGTLTSFQQNIRPGFPCRIYGMNFPMASTGPFVLETCKRLMSFFENYFEIPFPLPKLDFLADKNFVSTGIASWGLGFLNEAKLSVIADPEHIDSCVILMKTVSRLLCQQWLGNMVGPKWWTQLWMYESLGTFMEYMAVDAIEPNFQVWLRFLNEVYLKGMENDALVSSRIIGAPVVRASQLKGAFYTDSLNKGAAILRMMESYIGPEKFRIGLKTYISTYSYDNTTSAEFWEAMAKGSEKPIVEVVNSWTMQPRFPLIRIISSRHENESRVITLYQDTFSSDGTTMNERNSGLWMIPISVSVSSNPAKVVKEFLMDTRTAIIKLSPIEQGEWFKLNPGMTSFYRVKYPAENYQQLLYAVRFKSLPPMDRIGLLNDMYAFAKSGISTCIELLNLLKAFIDENNYFVWVQIDSIIHGLDILLHSGTCYKNYQSFVRFIYKSIYEKLGWHRIEGEPYTDVHLRDLVMTRMLMCGHKLCEEDGYNQFENLMLGEEFLPGQIGVLYKAGMIRGDMSTFQNVIRRFRLVDIDEREQILQSLGFSRDEVVLRQVLEFSVSDHVRHQDTIVVFKSMTVNSTGRHLVWEFFKERWTILAHRYPPGSTLTAQLLQAVTGCFSTEEKHVELSEFFRRHRFPGSKQVISQNLERIRNSAAWLKRERGSISDYLSAFVDLD